ncbi:helix-turn-helix domain-containing protein [Defluviimonas sp. D31]|uniref:helix-turn-helix transcriptional regulator n=1 Tax=Defluviimonas sp. D31 TaxID=3083253 RepID=UPI00296F0021|nr:helix-turn-helix domain-containing protein [Defluviimonas sp. D31]MDW4550124.1 helix-turn-helix domain-containing protein [Defluviimonas sp. D31]
MWKMVVRARRKTDPKFTRAALLIPFATAFARRGGQAEDVVLGNQLPLEALTNPQLLIEASTLYAAIENMAAVLGDPYFGATVAVEVAHHGTPVLRDAAHDAVTLGDFLSRAVTEVAAQFDNVRYSLHVTADAASFEIQRTLRVSGALKQIDAIVVCFYVTVFRLGLGAGFDPKRLIVTAPSRDAVPPGFLPRSAFITSPINGLRISFPTEWLTRPFKLDWALAEISRGEFGDDPGAATTVAYFRNLVAENLEHTDPLAQFARNCGMHPRRIQRLLAAQGTSYRRIRDEARRSLAVKLVSESRIPFAEIAQRVGFSSLPALDRAFRQWTGKTPTAFRAESLMADPGAAGAGNVTHGQSRAGADS